MSSGPYIGTHDSTFHCDDVTACYMLKQLDKFKNHHIVRTRNADTLAKAEIIVDVGGELDVERLRLDHHQRSFNQTIHNYHPTLRTTNPKKAPRLSSAGLVYAIFGKECIMSQLNLGRDYAALDEDKKMMIDAIYEKAYVEFMEEIDAIDNGVEIAEGDNIQYNYHINSGISNRVGRMNPISMNASDEERLENFYKAMKVVGDEMSEGIVLLAKIWWPRRQEFKQYILKRHEFDPSGQIVFIDGDLVGWKSALLDLEEELNIVGQLKFIVFHNKNAGESHWRATAVPVELKSFLCRLPLKQEWCGKRDVELQKISGVSDAVFVHMNGFTGGASSKEGILNMLHKTLGLF